MGRNQDTQSLIERAQAGDRNAFGQLIEQCRDRLEEGVRIRLGPHLRQRLEVEDVLQETFLKAFQSMPRFRPQGDGSFFNWLRGIAENLLLHHARQHQRTRKFGLAGDVADSGTSPSRGMLQEERFDRLQTALESLSPDHREVILLARVEGLSMKAIAERVHRSPNAVVQLLWRALKNLRDAFGETESFHLPSRRLLFFWYNIRCAR